MSKLKKNSKDSLVDEILRHKEEFIEKYGETPKVVLLSRDNFLKLRNWAIDHPTAEVMQTSSMIAGMWIVMDPGSDIYVGGL